MTGQNRQAWLRAEREAVNHPIQGTAADIVKVAMLALFDKLRPYQATLLLQVHDELLVELPEEEVEVVRPLLIETMIQAAQLDVPLKVGASVGANWLELKD
jgi:DNA polymerase-1